MVPPTSIPMEQSAGDSDPLPPQSDEGRGMRNARLVDLLSTAAALVAQLDVEEPVVEAARAQQADGSTIIQAWEVAEPQPVQAATILSTGSGAPDSATILSIGWESLHAKFDLALASRPDMPSVKKYLPFV
ncbi:unnamed protein product [Lampetra fluviatilis]